MAGRSRKIIPGQEKEAWWIGYRNFLSKDEVSERFGAEFAKLCTYKKQKANEGKDCLLYTSPSPRDRS